MSGLQKKSEAFPKRQDYQSKSEEHEEELEDFLREQRERKEALPKKK